MRRIKALASAMILAGLAFKAAAESLVENGSFDRGISGWVLEEGFGLPWTAVTWDPAQGSPVPGSLKLSSTLPAGPLGTDINVFSKCVDTLPDEVLALRVMVLKPFSQPGSPCAASLALYAGRGCTGGPFVTGDFPRNEVGVWEAAETVLRATAPVGSIRVSLTLLVGFGTGEKVCLFDSVELRSDVRGRPSPVAIPTLGEAGVLLLAVILAVTAVAWSRSVRAGPALPWPGSELQLMEVSDYLAGIAEKPEASS